MRILQISEYCHAGSIGGTERYLLELIRGLQAQGADSQIGWLSSDKRRSFYSEKILIHSLPNALMRVDEPPPQLAVVAESLLDGLQPDVVHFHTFGLAEAAVARIVWQRSIPYVFTYHSAGWTCRRGDLLIWGGNQPCDGEVRTLRCAACKVQERFGGPALGGYLGALLSGPLDLMFMRSSRVNFRRRACFLSDTRRYRKALREFLGGCSLAVSCSDWGKPVLVVNGARPECVKIIPQGAPMDFVESAQKASDACLLRKHGKPFTIGYIGRITPDKGVDILVEGFTRVPGNDLRLKIYGYVAGEKSVNRLNGRLESLARKDARIELHPRLPLAEMVRAYSELDLVAIPSVWLETGPLVLFEALQMGIPVFSSNRIGHLGLLKEVGVIVEPNTPRGWREALTRAANEHRNGDWDKRRMQICHLQNLRVMSEVATEMMSCYNTVLDGESRKRLGNHAEL
jgi:glycosyltransferase involved in cell wall biosynthesis